MGESIVVFGGGGHAKVVVSTMLALGLQISAIIDDNEDKWGQKILGVPVTGPQDNGKFKNKRGIIAIGDNHTRKRLAGEIADIKWETIIHPQAYVHPTVSIGAGSVVFAGAVIQPDVVIGEHCIINSNASIDHDCFIGDFAHIGPGTTLAGGVSVLEGGFLGIGSIAIIGMNVGQWSIIGAGGVVIENIPDKVTAVGIPARVIKHHNA